MPPTRQAGRCKSIWRPSMMPPSALPAMVTPKFISPSDPAAQWTGALAGQAFFAYATNYLIDTRPRDHRRCRSEPCHPSGRGRRRTHHDRADQGPLRPQARAARRRQRLWLGRDARLAGQGARDRAAYPGVRQVRPHGRHLLARPTSPSITSTTSMSARKARCCSHHGARCVGITMARTLLYRASKLDCDPVRSSRSAVRTRPPARSRADLTKTPATWPGHRQHTTAFEHSRRERKKVEMLFAHLKRILSSVGSDYADPAAPATSSISPPPPRTSGSSPSSSRCRSRKRPEGRSRRSTLALNAAPCGSATRPQRPLYRRNRSKASFSRATVNGRSTSESRPGPVPA